MTITLAAGCAVMQELWTVAQAKSEEAAAGSRIGINLNGGRFASRNCVPSCAATLTGVAVGNELNVEDDVVAPRYRKC
ncbi:MAG: hypothetical protein ABIK25_09750 [Pseudomonadota bacterium]